MLSYSSLPGSLRSKQRDYVEILTDAGVSVEVHRGDRVVSEFLAAECCSDRTVGQALTDLPALSAQASGIAVYDLGLDIVLVPPDTEYAYVTKYRTSQPTVRFAFHYDPLQPDVAVARIGRVIAHEMRHILAGLGQLPAPNKVSEEASAVLMGSCTSFAEVELLPDEIATILPEDAIMDEIRSMSYNDAIERMAGSPPSLMGQIIAQLDYESLMSTRGPEGFETLCREKGYLGHNFLNSSFVLSQTPNEIRASE
ncbi:MAG: hypothetical protein ACSHX3_13160 [Litorimonas sp.]